MSRVALVVPATHLRSLLVVLADAGVAQLVGPLSAPQGEAVEALRRLERGRSDSAGPAAKLAAKPPDLGALERSGGRDLLAGEVELARRADGALRRGRFAALVAWVPTDELPPLRERLADVGAAAVELPHPAFVAPPTSLRTGRVAGRFRPLVDTYGASRYTDVDPTPFAAASFVLMFGMMFGDVGHGLALVVGGLLLRRARSPRLQRIRPLWPFPVAGGAAAAVFGVLYGEAFGPTGLVPTLWVSPLDEPLRVLAAAVAVGGLLLAVSYALGILNRWREAGARAALLAPSGVAGLAVFAGGGSIALGVVVGLGAVVVAGVVMAVGGIALLLVGFAAEAGFTGSGIAQSLVEVFDAVVRVGSNVVSFTRLAAFGLMHAALGAVVLDGAVSLWGSGAAGAAAAVVVFVVGNAAAFALEALVAGVQAMRLEYYELFSRVFAGEGEPFSPWRLPVVEQDRSS